MISSVLIMTPEGDVLVEKNMREKLPRAVLDEFWKSSEPTPPSCAMFSQFAFFTKRVNDIFVVATATQDVAPTFAHEILNLVQAMITAYVTTLSQDSVREHFSIVYQLLEELLDYGYPLTTETHEMEELVALPTIENKMRHLLDIKSKTAELDSTRVPWRNGKITYAANELLFDITEFIDAVMDAEGNVSRCTINGNVSCVSRLSGNPDLCVTFVDPEQFEDIAFHRCVRLSAFESNRHVCCVPPDGRFTLCEFRSKPPLTLRLPFYVSPQVSFNKEGGRVSIMVGVRHGDVTLSKEESHTTDIEIRVPLPSAATGIRVSQAAEGTSHSFNAATRTIIWKVGGVDVNTKAFTCNVVFAKPLDKNPGPYGECIGVDFVLGGSTLTGVRISSANVRNESYKMFKGMKNVTRAGRFFVRPQ